MNHERPSPDSPPNDKRTGREIIVSGTPLPCTSGHPLRISHVAVKELISAGFLCGNLSDGFESSDLSNLSVYHAVFPVAMCNSATQGAYH